MAPRTTIAGAGGKTSLGKTGVMDEPTAPPIDRSATAPVDPLSYYPEWAAEEIRAGRLDPARFEEVMSAGFDVSSPEVFQQSAFEQAIRAQEVQQMEQRDQSRNDQFGNDMSWLDPAFQYEAATVTPTTTADALRFGVTADPEAMARQQSILNSVTNRGLTADGATETAQRSFLGELEGRGTTADAASEATQRGLISEIEGRGRTADAGAEEAQQSALDELFGLYRQGGQSAQDRAARARNRADTENWLQGQRQADIQDRAERGMSGSGGEVLDLLADRQAAASRLSAGDLEADAAAEKRALDALLSGTDLATGMRSASDEYEATNTRARADVANQMRTAADSYQQSNDQTRGSTMDQMRSAADTFQVNNDRTAADLATGMRDASDRYVGANADRLGESAEINARLINDAREAGKRFLQDAYRDTMDRRDTWDRELLGLQTDVATGTRSHDAGQNTQGWNMGADIASTDTAATNRAQDAYNTGEMSTWLGGSPAVLSAEQNHNNAFSDFAGSTMDLGAEAFKMMGNAAGGGMGGGGFASGAMGGGMGSTTATNRPLPSNIKDPWEEF
jgi:hypothetical protein